MSIIEFNKKFDNLADSLNAFAYNLTKNTEDAKDLYQETAFRVITNRDKFKPETNFKAWTFTIMKNIILFSGVTFFMVFAWISLSIYHNQTTSTITPNVQTQIAPIVPKFDTQTLNNLKTRTPVEVNLSQAMQLFGKVTLLSSVSAKTTPQTLTAPPETPVASDSSELTGEQAL